MKDEREKWLRDILQGDDDKPTETPGMAVDGKKRAAALLSQLDSGTRNRILGDDNEQQSGIGKQIRDLMFTFDDLVLVDKRHIPLILKQIKSRDLILALKKTKPEVKAWIFKSVSSRMAERIQEEMDRMSPVRLSDVEEAQKKIAKIARQLEEDGKIAIQGRGERYV